MGPRINSSDGDANDRTSRTGGVAVGRRIFLGLLGVAGLGIVVGESVQRFFSNVVGSKLGTIFTGGNGFRIYTVSGTYPEIHVDDYRLEVSGLVDSPAIYSLADLQAMPATKMVKTFQCVTGWQVPNVEWEGVRLSHLLTLAGVQPDARAITFESYDNTDSESLTIDQAHLPDVLVAYQMLGTSVTTEHGGPVRLYVAPMFGYKSLKWLSAIRVVSRVEPGYWEQNGYPSNGWRDGSTGDTNSNPELT